MKWLKIKKCLKIFSVIICSIFIFSNKAKAYKFEFDNKTFDTKVIFEEKMANKYTSINIDDYKYRICYYTSDKNSIICLAWKKATFADLNNNTYLDNNTSSDMINNPNYVLRCNGGNNSGWVIQNGEGENKGIYYKYTKGNTESFNYGGLSFLYTPDNMTYEEYLNDRMIYSNINFSPGFIFDTREYYYEYTKENENPLKYRMQFNNDVSPNLKQITFDFSSYEFTEGSNPVKAKIEIGSWNEAVSLSNYLSQVITGYGLNNIETDLTSYFDISVDITDYLTTKELIFTYTLKQDLPSDILRLKVYYDFETFDNNYYFNVFDNTTWGTPIWNYIENFLVGYKKYTFPEGYDLAIIRSKSFKDLESFYISDKVYFTNPDYDFNLKLYDFNNKIEKYNFNSLTQYLINPVYLKIPIKIDETNNIFPVLTKPMNNESGVFYLKDDLFIQFVNSENLDSIIENIPEDDFNDNNDLIIDNDIGNLNPPQQDEQNLTVFFNEFWKMFEKFSDILSYITSCFTQFFISLPTTIQFFLCISFAFVIYKMLVFFIL